MQTRWLKILILLSISIRQFGSFWEIWLVIKRRKIYLIYSPLFSLSNSSKFFPSSLLRTSNRYNFQPLASILSLLISSNCWRLSTIGIFNHLISTQYWNCQVNKVIYSSLTGKTHFLDMLWISFHWKRYLV